MKNLALENYGVDTLNVEDLICVDGGLLLQGSGGSGIWWAAAGAAIAVYDAVTDFWGGLTAPCDCKKK